MVLIHLASDTRRPLPSRLCLTTLCNRFGAIETEECIEKVIFNRTFFQQESVRSTVKVQQGSPLELRCCLGNQILCCCHYSAACSMHNVFVQCANCNVPDVLIGAECFVQRHLTLAHTFSCDNSSSSTALSGLRASHM